MGPETENIHLIPLTKGQFARVDAEDWEPLMKFKWAAAWRGRRGSRSNGFNAVRRTSRKCGKPVMILMHRQLMGLTKQDPIQVDHRDLDALNNTRKNLRFATNGQNQQNMTVTKRNRLGIKGVWQMNNGRYRSMINADGRVIHLGVFPTPETASEAYNRAATKYHGEFARLG